MVNFSLHFSFVKKMWKTICKSWCKKGVPFCVKIFSFQKNVYMVNFFSTFSHHSTIFPTTIPPLYQINFFHYSTKLTITTNINF